MSYVANAATGHARPQTDRVVLTIIKGRRPASGGSGEQTSKAEFGCLCHGFVGTAHSGVASHFEEQLSQRKLDLTARDFGTVPRSYAA